MNTLEFLNMLFFHYLFSYSVFILCLLVKAFLWTRVKKLQKGTLSNVPGPRIAGWSRLWIAKVLYTGKSHEVWVKVNERYGPVARIGPKHLLTDDPAITRRVLAARSGYKRGAFFDSLRINPDTPNIISERNPKKHAAIRTMVAPTLTGRSTAAIEPIIDEQILGWVKSLKTRFTTATSPISVVDIGKKIQFLTVDIITQLCLGEAIGCVKYDRDMHSLLETIETGNKVCQYFSVFTEFNNILFWLARIPIFRKTIFPKPSDTSGVGSIMGLVHKVAERREARKERGSDFVSVLMDKGMSREQIDSEVVVLLAGGSDTTSTSIQSTLLCIATDPRVYAILRAEISAAIQQGVSTPIRDNEARQLVYLQACVLEGLRKHPPLSQLRERVVPAGGDNLGGFHVPAGTLIGFNSWGTQMRPDVYGEDAALFRPERWLTDDTDRLREMHATHSLIFGHGTTKCLGMAMAMMEIPKVLFELLRNFDVSIADPHRSWKSQCYGIFHQDAFRVCLRPVSGCVEQIPVYGPLVKPTLV